MAGIISNNGSVAGTYGGIKVLNAPGTVTNSGTVLGASKYGIYFGSGGTVGNSGTIGGGREGVKIAGTLGNVQNTRDHWPVRVRQFPYAGVVMDGGYLGNTTSFATITGFQTA